MIVPGSLWVACTVAAAAGQTLRNAMQHSLIGTVGTAGATHVRFLYGLPFACVFLAVVASTGAIRDPQLGLPFWCWSLRVPLFGSGAGVHAGCAGSMMLCWVCRCGARCCARRRWHVGRARWPLCWPPACP